MNLLIYPSDSLLNIVLQRPQLEKPELNELVSTVFEEVKAGKNKAVTRFVKQFDKSPGTALAVTPAEFKAAEQAVEAPLKEAIRQAYRNIRLFHESQLVPEEKVETMPGVSCWRKSVPIQRVGLYIPGGSAPLFSTVLMLGVPATLAGCREIVLCTPADSTGNIHPALLFTASLLGITNVFKVGGIQAIAAMTYGTETIPAVYKLFGPGNQFVTAAKNYAQQLGVAIDLPAGPSEVMVVADDQATAPFVAADLIAQAEHGADSQVILVTDSELLANKVLDEIEQQLLDLPRKTIAQEALKNSCVIVTKNEQFPEIINAYAPEHLILSTETNEAILPLIENAGSVFIGRYTPESAGDYASGTNHTLPTNGAARSYSGASVDSFVKKITFQEISREGLKGIGPVVELMAEAEQLTGHKNAVSIRIKQLNNEL